MKNKKRIIIILICVVLNLAIMACHIPLFSQSISIQATSTEIPKVATISPTEIEDSETVSPSPSQEIIPDSEIKQVYSVNGVEITLPGTFVVGDAEEIEVLLEEEELLDSEHSQTIKSMFENFKDDILLWGYDNNPKSEEETGLFVMKNDQFGGMPLMMISAFTQTMIGSQAEIVEQEIIKIDDRDVLRFFTSTADINLPGSQVFYIFNQAGKLWIIGFFTNTNQVQENLQVFDDAVASFNLVDGE